MKEFVVDASVVLACCFPDENSGEGDRILGMLRASAGLAWVPAFFHQEVLNALLMGERRKRIAPAESTEFMSDLLTLPISPATPDKWRILTIEELSRKHALTAYDATYLELALRLDVPLASFDKALNRARHAEGLFAI